MLYDDVRKGYINSEHWFSNPSLWYQLTAYSNPYFTIYSELVLLVENKLKINKYLKDKTMVFYGLGTGDTELVLVNNVLKEKKKVDIIGIDVQKQFIDGFVQSLHNLDLENKKYEINFLGIAGLFQDVKPEYIKVTNKPKVHIMLGNTIGNFKENKIFNIFDRLISKGDFLIIGFQIDKNIQTILQRFSKNKIFNEFVRKSIPKCELLEWKYNKEDSQIEAWSKNILVFHSKKINPKDMIKRLDRFDFKNLFSVQDNNSCVQGFVKK